MGRHTILMLGGSTMQLPAIQSAKTRGWTVVLADGNASCVARPLADAFHHVDLVDLDGLVGVAEQYDLDGVFTAGTDFSTSVAYVAEKRGLPGIPFKVAQRATDKLRMRRAFAHAGVPSPDYVEIAEGQDPIALIDRLGLPVVVKPVDNMGSRGVQKVEDPAELEQTVRRARAASRSARVIAERFMEGPELSLDAIVYRGVVTVCGIADRHIHFPPYFVEMGHTMPSDLDPSILSEVTTVFERGVKAIGIENGAAKGDIKVTPHGPMVGEIAARLSGGYMSGWTYPYSSGVPLTAAAMNVAVGLEPGDLTCRERNVSAERAFISIPGIIASIEGLDEAASIPGVCDLFRIRAPNDRVTLPHSNVEKCGNIISKAATRAEAVAAAEEAIRRIFVRLTPATTATDEFLLAEGGPFHAYHLEQFANTRTLQSMPEQIVRSSPASVVSLLTLPELEREGCLDWHGWPLQSALARVCQLTRTQVGSHGDLVLGRRFWTAFLRGGIQGGVYAVETARGHL